MVTRGKTAAEMLGILSAVGPGNSPPDNGPNDFEMWMARKYSLTDQNRRNFRAYHNKQLRDFPFLATPNLGAIHRVGYAIQTNQKFSPSWKRDNLIVLERWAEYMGITDDKGQPVHFNKGRQTQRDIKALTLDQVKLILGAIKDAQDYLIIYTLVKTGMRREELADLNIGDVDFINKLIWINHGKGDKERKIDLDAEQEKIFRLQLGRLNTNYREKLSNPMFVNRLGERYVPAGIGEIAEKVGQFVGIPTNTHLFRHTFATIFVNNGGNPFALMRLMGHSNLNVTLRYYTFSEEMRKSQYMAHAPKLT